MAYTLPDELKLSLPVNQRFGKLAARGGWMLELNSIVHTALRRRLVIHYLRHLVYLWHLLVYLHHMNSILLR